MKKTLLKIITFIMAIVMTASMAACDLVTIDNEKVNEQVIATVKVYDGAPEESITNQQLLNLYYTYAPTYIYYYGYTAEEAADAILETMIQSRVYAQNAMNYFNNLSNYADLNAQVTDIWDVDRYLTQDEITEAEYNITKSVNDAIDGFIEEDEDVTEEESFAPTVRTAPTGATVYAHELTVEEMADYVEKGVQTGSYAQGSDDATTERRIAYYKLLKSMEVSGYIDADFNWATDSVLDTDYFKQSLKDQKVEILITKYDAYLTYDYYKTISFENIEADYAKMYKDQAEADVTDASYYEALSSATAAHPVVYNPFTGYSYVYNLLLGADNVQAEKIAKIKADYEDVTNAMTEADYRAQRNAVLNDTYVKDLRSSWITAGYDFDFETKKFLNDYALASDTLPFDGNVTWTNKTVDGKTYVSERLTDENGTYFKYKVSGETVYDDTYAPKYTAKANTKTFAEFVTAMDTYLYGSAKTGTNDAINGIPVYKLVDSSVDVEEWDEKINELLFAYSTDPGSLNTYKGYAVSPETENGTETYVDEFAAAARALMNCGKTSYVIVGTDYGYHVIFFSKVVSATSYATLVDYLNAEEGSKNWADVYEDMIVAIRDGEVAEYEDSYLYSFQQVVTANAATANVAKIKMNDFYSAKENSKVAIYQERIDNLFAM
jgi:hypothetical protein